MMLTFWKSTVATAAALLICSSTAAQPSGAVRWSTYLGGAADEQASAAIYDENGDLWLCGNFSGPNAPFAEGGDSEPAPGGGDFFVMRIAVTEDDFGSRSYERTGILILGGSERDVCNGFLLAPGNRIYLAGSTESPDFPMLRDGLTGPGRHILLMELGLGEDGDVDLSRAVALGVNGGGDAFITSFEFLAGEDGSFKVYVSGSAIAFEEDATIDLGPFVSRPLRPRSGFVLRLDDELNPERGFGFGAGPFAGGGQLVLGDPGACEEIVGGPAPSGSPDELACFLGSAGADSLFGSSNPAPNVQTGFAASFSPRNMAPFRARFLPAMAEGEEHLPILLAGGRPIVGGDKPGGAERSPWFTASLLQDAERTPSAALTTLDGRVLLRENNALWLDVMEGRDGSLFLATLQDRTLKLQACQVSESDGPAVRCTVVDERPAVGGLFGAARFARGSDGPLTWLRTITEGLTVTENALQPSFGGGETDIALIHWDSPELLGVANAAFNGQVSPGDLTTIFGSRLGPRKSEFASAELTGGALPESAGGLSVSVSRDSGQTIQARVLNASYGQASFEMPQELAPGERVELRFENAAGERSNAFPIRLSEHDVAPFLFNGTEAIVQQADGSIATDSNPLAPGAFAIAWFNSGHPKSPSCPGAGAVSSPSGDPLLGFLNQEAFRWQLRAFTEDRAVVATGAFLYIGNSPGQLCAVGQANFQIPPAASWASAEVETALAEAARLEREEPERYRELRGVRPFVRVGLPDGVVELELVISN